MKNFLKLSLLITVLSACSHDFNGPYEKLMAPVIKAKLAEPNKVFDGEIEPPMPDPVENNKTVLGVDVNKNDVRDDVEIFINRTYSDSNVRKVMKQYVRDKARFIRSVKFNDLKISKDALEKRFKTLSCLRFVYPNFDHELVKKVSKVFNNEKFRDDAYGKSRSIVGPSPVSAGSSDFEQYEKYCEFKIDNYEKTKESFWKVIKSYEKKK